MRKLISILGITTLAVIACPPTAMAGETLDRVMKNKVLVEVTDQAYPPFSYIDETGEVVGFDIDIAREFAKRLGVELRVETPSWEIIVAGNWNDRWDICICSMTPTSDRAQVLDFVNEYYSTPANIVVNADNNDITSAADLTGKKVGAQAGSTYERYLLKELKIEKADAVEFPFDELKAVPYESEVTAFQDLALGTGKRLDAVISGYLAAEEKISAAPGQFKIVSGDLFHEPIWVSVDKGDPEWQETIKAIFGEMAADGTLKAISEKWVGIDITSKQP